MSRHFLVVGLSLCLAAFAGGAPYGANYEEIVPEAELVAFPGEDSVQAQVLVEANVDKWTQKTSGCTCTALPSMKTCACCNKGGCQGSRAHMNRCFKCPTTKKKAHKYIPFKAKKKKPHYHVSGVLAGNKKHQPAAATKVATKVAAAGKKTLTKASQRAQTAYKHALKRIAKARNAMKPVVKKVHNLDEYRHSAHPGTSGWHQVKHEMHRKAKLIPEYETKAEAEKYHKASLKHYAKVNKWYRAQGAANRAKMAKAEAHIKQLREAAEVARLHLIKSKERIQKKYAGDDEEDKILSPKKQARIDGAKSDSGSWGSSGTPGKMKWYTDGVISKDTTLDNKGHYFLGRRRRRVGAGFGRRRMRIAKHTPSRERTEKIIKHHKMLAALRKHKKYMKAMRKRTNILDVYAKRLRKETMAKERAAKHPKQKKKKKKPTSDSMRSSALKGEPELKKKLASKRWRKGVVPSRAKPKKAPEKQVAVSKSAIRKSDAVVNKDKKILKAATKSVSHPYKF